MSYSSLDFSGAVIRPRGVWNSRWPLHNYLLAASETSRDHAVLTIAVYRTRHAIDDLRGATPSIARFLKVKESGLPAGNLWQDYRKDWRRRRKSEGQPDFGDFNRDLGVSLYFVREMTVIGWVSAFESFCQCWALNMLLARLEQRQSLTQKEAELRRRLSPIHHAPGPAPGVPKILECFPDVSARLELLPHVNTHPATKTPVVEPLHPRLTTLHSLLFWRDYRNCIVHQGGRVSQAFIERHGEFYEAFRDPYAGKFKELSQGNRLNLPDVTLAAMATVHNKAAAFLNSVLVTASKGTRGKITGPDEEEPLVLDHDRRVEPLLREGDHGESLEWVLNHERRERAVMKYNELVQCHVKGSASRRESRTPTKV